MKKPQLSSTRLWVLLARAAPVAAIFRRGPSRQVQVIKWNLDDDTFELGQWLKGRIYERRCDLSPAGTLLIYFAAKYKEPLYSWTAISKLPWLSALALWPKGDAWNGGGHFTGPREIHLDHFPAEAAPHPDFESGCRKFRVASLATMGGEDAPVWHHTLKRDGWRGVWENHGKTKRYSGKICEPKVWRKPHEKLALHLEMSIQIQMGLDNGPWYVTDYRVVDKAGVEVVTLGLADWADWDKGGDLLYARNGCLFRQPFKKSGPSDAVELADFSANKFTPVKAPESAMKL